MISNIFVVIQLATLQLCVSDPGYNSGEGISKHNEIITLIDDPGNYDNQRFNTLFEDKCANFYNIVRESVGKQDGRNLIYYGVKNYHDSKYKNFLYAGDINGTIEVTCNITNTTKPSLICNEKAKLVSSSILEIQNGDIYEFVESMQYVNGDIGIRESCYPYLQGPRELKNVLLCLDTRTNPGDISINIEPLKLIITNGCMDSIKKCHNNLLGVLAPSPFEVDSEYLVPTMFYGTPYLTSVQKADFPNSMNMKPWRLLKYGFLKFLEKAGIGCVVIVSDDSEYSDEFEKELTDLFNKEGIVYTVVRCEEIKCDINKTLESLATVRARIVVANVEQEYAKLLIKQASFRITWIVRDMHGARNEFITHGQGVFSIHLIAINTQVDLNQNILDGLSILHQTYLTEAYKYYTMKKLDFYRSLAAHLKQYVNARKPEAAVLVEKLTYSDSSLIAQIYVNESGALLASYRDPFVSGKPNDGPICLMTSYNYFKTCEDHLLLSIMFVIVMFILLVILISCFFHKTSPYHDIRYQNF